MVEECQDGQGPLVVASATVIPWDKDGFAELFACAVDGTYDHTGYGFGSLLLALASKNPQA